MSLKDCKIKPEYVSLKDNVPRDFFIPLLKEATLYKRAVGYFSSTALIELSKGICSLIKNGGKIQIIASPDLSDEDVNAIKEGYEFRKIIEQRLLENLTEHKDYESMERLNLLASLIADEKLDIKIACTKTFGIYHQKIGIIFDNEGNKVAFSGSANETLAAMVENYESFDVFKSWENEEQFQRVEAKCEIFDSIWSNNEDTLIVMDFPDVKTEFIKKYRNSHSVRLDLDEVADREKNIPSVPPEIEFHDYQKEAIENWASQNYCGIFDMATGTGKTLTGLGALTKLSNDLNNNLAVIIVVPYQHLVEQWVEDIIRFNIKPIIGYSASPQGNWKDRLKNAINSQNLHLPMHSFFCFVTTNATFKNQFVQKQIDRIKGKILLVVDEAHNAGSKNFSNSLDNRFCFRLALSATLERHHDEEGSAFLHSYFGEKAIEYDLQRAIDDKKLTPYKYYPILVYFSEDELIKYRDKTNEISRHIIKGKNGKIKLDSYGELLAIQRSRIIAGTKDKLKKFKNVLIPYKNKHNILVYCGATTVNMENESSESYRSFDETGTEERQIIAVTKILGEELEMSVSRFTSEEDIETRKTITQKFKDEELQAIVAIKCLDEGVNIPSIKTAFILASTTNPKEYIQRRGRVLRLWKDKPFAEIYDFVTLPVELDTVKNFTKEEIKGYLSLVKNELRRIKEFSQLALNEIDSLSIISKIQEVYEITDKDLDYASIDTIQEEFYEQ
ncbi:MAG: DEAD/DEAH box helicase family protein [Treponema sp.]|nr:DEAD/DEAH box helicase family protein [Treponema sp.]